MNSDLHYLMIEARMLMNIVSRMSRMALEQQLTAQDIDLSSLQYGILRTLQKEGDQTLSELSRKFVLDPSTLVPTINSLQGKGLIQRQRDDQDRRRFPISLTDQGEALIKGLPLVADHDPFYQGMEAVGLPVCQQFLDTLRQIVRHMPDGEETLALVQAHHPLPTNSPQTIEVMPATSEHHED